MKDVIKCTHANSAQPEELTTINVEFSREFRLMVDV